MDHNSEKEREEMTEREFMAMMKSIRLIAVKAETKEQFLEEFDEITGIKKEPTPTTK